FAGSGALGRFGQIRVTLDPLPAHLLQLEAEWPLDKVVFPPNSAHAKVSAGVVIVSGTRTDPLRRSFLSPHLRCKVFVRPRVCASIAPFARSSSAVIASCSRADIGKANFSFFSGAIDISARVVPT